MKRFLFACVAALCTTALVPKCAAAQVYVIQDGDNIYVYDFCASSGIYSDGQVRYRVWVCTVNSTSSTAVWLIPI